VERDYTDGELSAANYERLSIRLAEELAAAGAQRAQAERHAADLDDRHSSVGDAALAALGDVHEAIAAFMADARHLDELRLRLRQLFETFTVEDHGETVALIPALRPEALDAVMADLGGVQRQAVRATTDAIGLAT
jgi:hypothetical protein